MKITEKSREFRRRPRACFVFAAVIVLMAGVSSRAQSTGASATASNPFKGDEGAVAEGRELYNNSCTACHGPEGIVGELGPALAAPGRRYGRRTDGEVFDAIKRGIPGTTMPPSTLSDSDAWKVTAYILGLRGTAIDAPAKGNVAKGEQIFLGKGDCGSCHMLKGKGGLIGPDLSDLASRRKLSSIRDALTKENHRVAGDGGRHDAGLEPLTTYQVVRVVTRDGKTIRGVLKNEDSFSLQMLSLDNALHLFGRDELREIMYEPDSLMPTDYDKRLTSDEFQDLLAFLSRQGSAAPPPQERRRGQE
jgi:putative heme-binding domain-containing protein